MADSNLKAQMNLIDLLDSDAADLPFTAHDDIEKQLRDRFDAYFTEAAKLSTSDPVNAPFLAALHDSKRLADAVIAALGHWLDAEPDVALSALDAGLAPLSSQVGHLTSVDVGSTSTGPMFRARVADLSACLGMAEMFHIPFEKRDWVAMQRYSFPGLPCLYMGRSLYVCWEELGRPAGHRLWVSKFQVAPNQTIRVLDFGLRPALVAAGLQHTLAGYPNGPDPNMAAAYAALWPLIAACSIRRHPSRQRSFVVEYVVPQLLLRWLVRRMRNGGPNKLDGIRYFSTHIEDHDVGIAGMNYVFPAQKRSTSGFCAQLQTKFYMTPPIHWQNARAGTQPPPQPPYNDIWLQLSPFGRVHYKDTDFSWVEGFLDQMQAHPVP
jgi:hypothetical protein